MYWCWGSNLELPACRADPLSTESSSTAAGLPFRMARSAGVCDRGTVWGAGKLTWQVDTVKPASTNPMSEPTWERERTDSYELSSDLCMSRGHLSTTTPLSPRRRPLAKKENQDGRIDGSVYAVYAPLLAVSPHQRAGALSRSPLDPL